jgi:antitoxin component YwqK of YwqJK toxin-antitoxin module
MNDKIQYNEEGNRHGYCEIYWFNLSLRYKGNYHNGKRHGYWECYYSNGNPLFKGNYDNDNSIGYWEYYWNNGKIKTQIFYS